MVNSKSTKLPIAWFSKVPKPYKCNAIIGDLHRSKIISINSANEVKNIKNTFLKSDNSLRFVISIIRSLDEEDPFIMPPSLFDEDKSFILIDITVCTKNKNKSIEFRKNFHHFVFQ